MNMEFNKITQDQIQSQLCDDNKIHSYSHEYGDKNHFPTPRFMRNI